MDDKRCNRTKEATGERYNNKEAEKTSASHQMSTHNRKKSGKRGYPEHENKTDYLNETSMSEHMLRMATTFHVRPFEGKNQDGTLQPSNANAAKAKGHQGRDSSK